MTTDYRSLARAGLLEIEREAGIERWVEARGSSMQPLIQPGDRILVAIGRLPERVGQVVVVERGGTNVAHRIVARANASTPGWITKGDGEAFEDAADRARVVGVVLGAARPTGQLRRRGFAGRWATWIARSSRFGGRAARRGRRLSRRLPRPVAGVTMRILIPLTRVPTRLITAPLPWLDQETRAEGR